MTAVIRIGIDPVLFHIGGLSIHWYGVMYALAFIVAFRFGALPYLTSRGIDRPTVERLTTWTIIVGLIGARLYYVVQQPNLSDYLTHPNRILAVWEGGMAFFGAIMAGLGTIAFFSWRKRLPFWLLWDAGALFAVVGQPIGRIGNLINGDILGSRSDLPWATAYTFHTSPDHCAVLQENFQCGVGYQPAAAYEALGTLAILAILFFLRSRQARPGLIGITYVAAYSVSQLILFQLRESEPAIFHGLKQAQLTSIVVLLVVFAPLLVLWWRGIGGGRSAAPEVPAIESAARAAPSAPASAEPKRGTRLGALRSKLSQRIAPRSTSDRRETGWMARLRRPRSSARPAQRTRPLDRAAGGSPQTDGDQLVEQPSSHEVEGDNDEEGDKRGDVGAAGRRGDATEGADQRVGHPPDHHDDGMPGIGVEER